LSLVLARTWFGAIGAGSLLLCGGYLVGATQGNQMSPLLLGYGIVVGCAALAVSLNGLVPLPFISGTFVTGVCIALAGSPFLWLVVVVVTSAQSAAAYAVPPVLLSAASSVVIARNRRRQM